jgi:hypothetical protein
VATALGAIETPRFLAVVSNYTITVQWLQPAGEARAFFSMCKP